MCMSPPASSDRLDRHKLAGIKPCWQNPSGHAFGKAWFVLGCGMFFLRHPSIPPSKVCYVKGLPIRGRGMLYRFEDFALDTERRELHRGAAPISVEPRVFDLIVYLIQNRGRVVSRDDLLASVWCGRMASESALRSCINAARGSISDTGEAQRLIKTLARKGIRFVGEVREEAQLPVVAAGNNPTEAPRGAPPWRDKPS